MRFPTMLLILLVVASSAFGQKKVVLTSTGQVLTLQKGQSSVDAVTKSGLVGQQSVAVDNCSSAFATFGYTPAQYPCNQGFVGYHHDVWGQWFLAPSSGTIETLYVWNQDANEMESGTAKFAMWKSNIYPGHGPGYAPYHEPRHSWGYYKDANLSDEAFGITPFKAFATDPTWIPQNVQNDSIIPAGTPDEVDSYDPLGDQIWPSDGDGSQSYPKVIPVGAKVPIVMQDQFYSPPVQKGDPIFVTMEQAGTHGAAGNNSNPATWCMSSTGIPTPPVNWKFYEHVTSGTRGWHARAEATWIWWMVMTATSDVAPTMASLDHLYHTLSTAPRQVNATIYDCNFTPGSPPESSGVASVKFTYSVDGGSDVTIDMPSLGGDNYRYTLPGAAAGSHVSYMVTATDVHGNVTVSPRITYAVVKLSNEYYYADTTAAYSWVELSGNGGTKVPSAAYFNIHPGGTIQGAFTDDGTAGPYGTGGTPVTFFGDTLSWCWFGANGGLAMTHTAADTQQLNGSGGSFPGGWNIPSSVGRLPGNSPIVDMPKNFVGPLFNDFSLAPSSADEPFAHGAIWFKRDGSKFTVEWDSAGVVSKLLADTLNSFEVIFDDADKSILFQWKNIHGLVGLDTSALIGLQADSLTKYMFLNRENNPPQLRPRAGKALRFIPVSNSLTSLDGWNLLSVPSTPADLHRSYVYPSAVSNAFGYSGSYQTVDPLVNGKGFWLKFNGATQVNYTGAPLASIGIPVNANWNMIGSIGQQVTVAHVVPSGTTINSPFFGYTGGYVVSPTIDPGQGYWVKTGTAGTLTISPSAASAAKQPGADDLSGLSILKVRDADGNEQVLYFGRSSQLSSPVEFFELPPSAPSGVFDVRFASQRMVEVHPSSFEGALSFPIQINSAKAPLIVSWVLKGSDNGYQLAYASGRTEKTMNMKGNGQATIAQEIGKLTLRVTASGGEIPASFSLGQNFPNPFNPTTEIDYALPLDAHVTIKIYNVTGQEVTTLFDDAQQAGYHTVSWDSRNAKGDQIGSGVYFYRLMATGLYNTKETYSETHKMMLLK